jgi:hypothetical protein
VGLVICCSCLCPSGSKPTTPAATGGHPARADEGAPHDEATVPPKTLCSRLKCLCTPVLWLRNCVLCWCGSRLLQRSSELQRIEKALAFRADRLRTFYRPGSLGGEWHETSSLVCETMCFRLERTNPCQVGRRIGSQACLVLTPLFWFGLGVFGKLNFAASIGYGLAVGVGVGLVCLCVVTLFNAIYSYLTTSPASVEDRAEEELEKEPLSEDSRGYKVAAWLIWFFSWVFTLLGHALMIVAVMLEATPSVELQGGIFDASIGPVAAGCLVAGIALVALGHFVTVLAFQAGMGVFAVRQGEVTIGFSSLGVTAIAIIGTTLEHTEVFPPLIGILAGGLLSCRAWLAWDAAYLQLSDESNPEHVFKLSPGLTRLRQALPSWGMGQRWEALYSSPLQVDVTSTAPVVKKKRSPSAAVDVSPEVPEVELVQVGGKRRDTTAGGATAAAEVVFTGRKSSTDSSRDAAKVPEAGQAEPSGEEHTVAAVDEAGAFSPARVAWMSEREPDDVEPSMEEWEGSARMRAKRGLGVWAHEEAKGGEVSAAEREKRKHRLAWQLLPWVESRILRGSVGRETVSSSAVRNAVCGMLVLFFVLLAAGYAVTPEAIVSSDVPVGGPPVTAGAHGAPLNSRISACRLRWGQMTVVDLALAAVLPSRTEYLDQAALAWFVNAEPSARWQLQLATDSGITNTTANSTNTTIPFSATQDGSRFLVLSSEPLGVYIVAIRGTSSGTDAVANMDVWMESIMMNIVFPFFPGASLMSTDARSWIINTLISFSPQGALGRSNPVFEGPIRHLETVLSDSAFRRRFPTVLVTGHSLGGAVAHVAAGLNNAQSVAFSSPGVGLSRVRFGLSRATLERSAISLQFLTDPATWVGEQAGSVLEVPCPQGTSGLKCHTSFVKACQMFLDMCGDRLLPARSVNATALE